MLYYGKRLENTMGQGKRIHCPHRLLDIKDIFKKFPYRRFYFFLLLKVDIFVDGPK